MSDISRQPAGSVIGVNLSTGDRYVNGKWRECLDEDDLDEINDKGVY